MTYRPHRSDRAGVYDDGFVVVHERTDGSRSVARARSAGRARDRRARTADRVRDCDRPGVMLAGAAHTYADRFGVLAG